MNTASDTQSASDQADTPDEPVIEQVEDHRHYASHDSGKEWGTPVWIWRMLGEALGGFDVDLAAGAERYPIAPRRVTKEDNLFATRVLNGGDAFCNPPYARYINPEWAGRLVGLWEAGHLDSLTVVAPNSSDTDYYDLYASRCDMKTEIGRRVEFYGGEYNASFATVVFSFGEKLVENEVYRAGLDALGRTWVKL